MSVRTRLSGSRTKCAEQSKLVSSHLCGLNTKLSTASMPSSIVPMLGTDEGTARPGRVDMEEDVVAAAKLADGPERIDGAHTGRPEAGDHAGRPHAGGNVLLDRPGERLGAEREALVGRDQPQRPAAQACDLHRLLDRGMSLLRDVDRERRCRAQPLLVDPPPRDALARRQDGAERGARGRVLDDAAEALGQPDHLPEPVEDAGLHLGRGRRGLPQHALGADRRGQHLGQDGGRARLAGK